MKSEVARKCESYYKPRLVSFYLENLLSEQLYQINGIHVPKYCE